MLPTSTIVAAGWVHSCGLRVNGTITCWGNDDHGQLDVPSGQFSAVAAGWVHSCGLRTSGTITCWDNNEYGQADAPDGQFGPTAADTPAEPATETDSVPGVVQGLRAVPRWDGGVGVTWSKPSDTGGTPIIRYEVEYSHMPLDRYRIGGTRGVGHMITTISDTSHVYRRPHAGVTYTVSVRAVNGVGAGTATTATFTTFDVPGVPRDLKASPRPDGGVEVRWSAPSDTGGTPITGYEVKYSRGKLESHPIAGDRPRWSITKLATGTPHIYEHLFAGVRYTVRVRAINGVGAGPGAVTANFTTLDVPGVPRDLKASPRPDGGVEVRWSAPSDTGGTPITGYEVEYSRGKLESHPIAGDRPRWSITKLATGTPHIYEHLYSRVTYTVSIRAINGVGRSRSAASKEFTTLRYCPTGNKFNTKKSGGFLGIGKSTRVVALQSFETNSTKVEAGDEGGKVSSAINLSQSSCSWIFGDAEVTGSAYVGDNAVVRDNAKIYGRAQVVGDALVFSRAEVYGNAVVHGLARISGESKVYGTASVYGNAEVYGDAKVHGDAELFGAAIFDRSMEADADKFDGTQEHEREGKRLYRELFIYYTNVFEECFAKNEDINDDEIKRSYETQRQQQIQWHVRNILSSPIAQSAKSAEQLISFTVLHRCAYLKTVRELAKELMNILSPPKWYIFIAEVALVVTTGVYVQALIELLKFYKTLDALVEASIPGKMMMEEFEKCDMSCLEP